MKEEKQPAGILNKLFKVYNDTYNFWVYLYIGDKVSMRKSAIKDLDWEPSDFDSVFNEDFGYIGGLTTNIVDDNGTEDYFIWLPEFISDTAHITYLGHESGHAAHHALIKRGWRDFNNEDVFHSYLYLKDFVFGKLLTQIMQSKGMKESSKEKSGKRDKTGKNKS